MNSNEIKTKLLSSDAYKSLTNEKKVVGICEQLDWEVIHGCYYTDFQEGKIREVDVLASQKWIRKTKAAEIFISLYLVIECKTAADYHLLFSNTPVPSLSTYLHSYGHWIGFGDE